MNLYDHTENKDVVLEWDYFRTKIWQFLCSKLHCLLY